MTTRLGRRALAGVAAVLPAAGFIGSARAQSANESTFDRVRRTKTLRIAALPGELRLGAVALRRRLMQRTDVVDDPDVRFVEVVPGARIETLARDAAERVHDHRVGEADRQRTLRRRIQRERQVYLVRLQVEHRIPVG